MTGITDRDRLIRTTRGENLSDSLRYYIEYSLDIRGTLTIWGGMSFYQFESMSFDDPSVKVQRNLVPVYEYATLHPATARILQIERELDGDISDKQLIEALSRFRQEHPEDGWSRRIQLVQMGYRRPDEEDGGQIDPDGILNLRSERDDRQEVLDRLLRQERQDILDLWGIDCPPDINSGENYGLRLAQDRGQLSGWFIDEFRRLGGDWERHLKQNFRT